MDEFEDCLIQELVSRRTEGETGARALDHAMRRSLMPVLARGILERLADGTTPKTLSIGLGEDGKWALNFG